jgi:hypothetical protein
MADAVEARFFVSGMTRRAYNPGATDVELVAVSRGEHNKRWAQATPSGNIKMTIQNEGAAAWFTERLGQEVQVMFSPAPAD